MTIRKAPKVAVPAELDGGSVKNTPVTGSLDDFAEGLIRSDRYQDAPDVPSDEGLDYSGPPPTYEDTVGSVTEHKRSHRFKRVLIFVCAVLLCLLLLVQLARPYIGYRHGQTQTELPLPNPPAATTTSTPDPFRSIIRHEHHNSVTGTFTLFDLIDISTTSGAISITVNIDPEGSANKPALLKLKSSSGSINVKFNINSPRTARPHDVSIESSSGSVSGTVAHAGKTDLTTSSGSLSVQVFPTTANESSLSTYSNSGSQTVEVHNLPFGEKLTRMKTSIVAAGSASLKVRFPSSWEGRVHARSGGSGKVTVDGDGLRFTQNSPREVMGYRGDGKDFTPVEVVGMGSGRITFKC